jgi:hypothetical protein
LSEIVNPWPAAEPGMPTIPESHRDPVEGPLIASLSTAGADGAPQVTAIRFVFEGDCASAGHAQPLSGPREGRVCITLPPSRIVAQG